MNKIVKILLSIMIVFLNALIVPLEGHNENLKFKSTAIVTVETVEKTIDEIMNTSINFEIDTVVEEMNQEMAEINTIEDRKEWFIAYKDIIQKYSNKIDPPETIYDYFCSEELDLLFHVVQAEIGDRYSFEQKVNVANVIFNRLNHERFPDTLLDILTPDQFSTISSGSYEEVEVSETTILACEYAFLFDDTTDGCLFFDSNRVLKYEYVYNDGAHNFYKLRE